MIDNINKILKGLDLDVSAFPGMIVIIALCTLALEILGGVFSLAKTLSIPTWVYHPGIVVISIVFSALIYSLGDIWDTIISDPLYGVSGKWLSTERPPFALFPAGNDLKLSRERATATLGPLYPNHIKQNEQGIYEGQYNVAKDILGRCGAWDQIERRLAWSKMTRSLIIPFLLFGVTFLGLAIGSFSFKWTSNPGIFLVIAVACIVFALIAFRASVSCKLNVGQQH